MINFLEGHAILSLSNIVESSFTIKKVLICLKCKLSVIAAGKKGKSRMVDIIF